MAGSGQPWPLDAAAMISPCPEDAKRVRTLAIETTGITGSLALFEDGRLLRERPLAAGQRSAQSLAPGIRDILAETGWKTVELRLIAVAVGPGSFTGLRIGVTTAKVLAYAIGAEVLGINTLSAVAERIVFDGEGTNAETPHAETLWTAIDAYRQQVFAARFRALPGGGWRMESETRLWEIDAWLAQLTAGDMVTGPALVKLEKRLPQVVHIAPRELWEPTAASVGQVALRDYAAGRREDVWSLLPEYYRQSAAEERRPM